MPSRRIVWIWRFSSTTYVIVFGVTAWKRTARMYSSCCAICAFEIPMRYYSFNVGGVRRTRSGKPHSTNS